MKNQSKKTRNIILAISIIIGLIANYELYNNVTCLIFLSDDNQFLLSWPIIVQYLLIIIVIANISFLVSPYKKIKYFFGSMIGNKYYYQIDGIIFSLILGFILSIVFILIINILSYYGLSIDFNLISIFSASSLLVSIIIGVIREFDLDVKFRNY